jgi:hypothetical protein
MEAGFWQTRLEPTVAIRRVYRHEAGEPVKDPWPEREAVLELPI